MEANTALPVLIADLDGKRHGGWFEKLLRRIAIWVAERKSWTSDQLKRMFVWTRDKLKRIADWINDPENRAKRRRWYEEAYELFEVLLAFLLFLRRCWRIWKGDWQPQH